MPTILHISDTHGRHRQLPELPSADIIVHSGDITENGTEEEVFDFIEWFCDLPQFRHKIFIAGNHDLALYHNEAIEGLDDNCHYLYNSSVEIEGLKFYGVPYFANDDQDGTNVIDISKIPPVDVLITHQPPYGIADEYGSGKLWGSQELLQKVLSIKPRYHLFGHVHKYYPIIEGEHTIFSNGVISSKMKLQKMKLINLQ